MPVPFQAASWAKRSDIPSQTLNGGISGLVSGVYGASFHAKSKVLQAFGPVAHSFTTLFGCALASTDEGKTWVDTYRGDQEPTSEQQMYVVGGFSLDLPNGTTYHYQVRAQITHAFLVADGSLKPGGIHLYASDNGTSYSFVRSLYSWPHVIADPPSTGGNNVLSLAPSFASPILIPGSGPAGKDAFWMAVSFQIDCGGNNNPTQFKAVDLWRSLDGLEWVKVRDLSATPPFNAGGQTPSLGQLFRSSTGRVFIGTIYTNVHDGDLINTDWTLIGGLVPFVGNLLPMYGGTLSTYRNGSGISGGFALVSCDDGGSVASVGAPNIPLNSGAFNLKLGPSEVIIVCPGFTDPLTQTVCYYSSDGGETWQGGEVWLASTIGERPVGMFMKSDGRPLVATVRSVFVSSDVARGIATIRTVCPLANAGLAAARPLLLCGAPLTPVCKD